MAGLSRLTCLWMVPGGGENAIIISQILKVRDGSFLALRGSVSPYSSNQSGVFCPSAQFMIADMARVLFVTVMVTMWCQVSHNSDRALLWPYQQLITWVFNEVLEHCGALARVISADSYIWFKEIVCRSSNWPEQTSSSHIRLDFGMHGYTANFVSVFRTSFGHLKHHKSDTDALM